MDFYLLLHIITNALKFGLIKHFKAIADSVSIPVILYSVKSRTGVNIEPQTCLELSKVPNIVAIKEASGDLSQIAEIANLCRDSLDIYSGNDDQTVPILSLGGIRCDFCSIKYYAKRDFKNGS
jgi:4-hydroxy-tetrahydrodipicolinate synthase